MVYRIIKRIIYHSPIHSFIHSPTHSLQVSYSRQPPNTLLSRGNCFGFGSSVSACEHSKDLRHAHRLARGITSDHPSPFGSKETSYLRYKTKQKLLRVLCPACGHETWTDPPPRSHTGCVSEADSQICGGRHVVWQLVW